MKESEIEDSRLVRVFLSSTFKDMRDERDALVKLFRRMDVVAAKRDVTAQLVDLRWGITDDAARNGRVLSVCLQEVENSRPFFIGLVGDKYGTCLDKEVLARCPDVLERFPKVKEYVEKKLSITEIEMCVGVLDAEADSEAAFFFKKDAQTECERHEALRSKLRESSYPCEDYGSIEDLVSKVEKSFLDLLDRRYPDQPLTPLESIRRSQKALRRHKCGVYIDDEENYKELDEWFSGDTDRMAVIAESGLGKSALIANWLEERKLGCNTICHFLGYANEVPDNILKRLVDEIKDLYELEDSGEHFDNIGKELDSLFARIVKQKPLLIVLDGLNQLSSANNNKQLVWLPALPSNVKMLVSTIPDDQTASALRARHFKEFELKPLDTERRVKLITEYLGKVGKELSPERVNRIATDAESANPLVLRSLLDDLIAFGIHEQLEERIEYYLSASSVLEFFDRVLLRAEEFYGSEFVRKALSLIALSRKGLSESELLEILDCDPLQWSELYCGYAGHFTVCNGLINFSHGYMFKAVKSRYLAEKNSEEVRALREIIISAIDSQPDGPRKYEELPFQYHALGDHPHLHSSLMNLEVFHHLYESNPATLALYWRALIADETYSLKDYLTEAFPSERLDEKCFNLSDFIEIYFGDYKLALAFMERYNMYAIRVYGKSSMETAISFVGLGSIYVALGNYDQSIKYFNISEKLLNENDNKSSYLTNCYEGIGTAYFKTSKYDKSKEFYEKLIEYESRRHETDNGMIALGYGNLGNICYCKSDYEGSLKFYFKAHKLFLELLGEYSGHVAHCYLNIGKVFNEYRDTKALEYYQKALSIRIKIFGESHPEIADCYHSISAYYNTHANYAKAIEMGEKALKIAIHTLGPDHLDTAHYYYSLGSNYSEVANYEKSLEYLELSLEIRLSFLGKKHYDIAVTYDQIGNVYLAKCDIENSLKFHELALNIRLAIFKENNDVISESYRLIANDYYCSGKYKESLIYYDKALSVLKEIFKEDNSIIAMCYSSIGMVYDAQGNSNEALGYHKIALSIFSKISDKDTERLSHCYKNIGSCYSMMEEYDKSIGYYEKSIEISIKNHGDCHDFVADIYSKEGVVYKSLALYEKSKECFEKALAMQLQIWGENHHRVVIAYKNLGSLYFEMPDFLNAKLCFDKVMSICQNNGWQYPDELDGYLYAISSSENSEPKKHEESSVKKWLRTLFKRKS